jgi:hypothetical protein
MITNAEFDAATRRGEIAEATEPRATQARYDRDLGHVIVDLRDGRSASFQPRLIGGLETATDDELGAVRMLGYGHGLHWDKNDTDISVPGLIAGLKAWGGEIREAHDS